MRAFASCMLLIGALLGCARHGVRQSSDENVYKVEVHYYDRNGDGRVDLETHHSLGSAFPPEAS